MEAVSPRASLFIACKERHNLFMNRELLDRKSLDRVSWSSITPILLVPCSGNLKEHILQKDWKPESLRCKSSYHKLLRQIFVWAIQAIPICHSSGLTLKSSIAAEYQLCTYYCIYFVVYLISPRMNKELNNRNSHRRCFVQKKCF